MDEIKYKQDINKYRIFVVVSLILVFVMVFMLILYSDYHNFYVKEKSAENYTQEDEADIRFIGNYSLSEKKQLRNSYYSMKPNYRKNIDKLKFISGEERVSDYRNKHCKDYKDPLTKCSALNNRKLTIKGFINEVTVLYGGKEDLKDMDSTICHEALHSVVYRNENFHPIVYDLGQEEVCYRKW